MSVFRCRQIELWDICPSHPINTDLSLQPETDTVYEESTQLEEDKAPLGKCILYV